MFEDLGKLIVNIQNNYNRICSIWDEKVNKHINLKKKMVIDAREDAEILDVVWRYHSLLSDESVNIVFALDLAQYNNSSVNSRVKAQNSIEYKLENYYTNHESGHIPLKKCLNDLMGIRIVIDKDFSYMEVKQYMEENFFGYKCIDSSKLSYIATHVYFEKGNTFFPWELQIWSKKDEENNYESHKAYKQEYTKWEKENKGGVESEQACYYFE